MEKKKLFDLRVFTGTRKADGEQFKYYRACFEDELGNKKYVDVKFTKAVEVLPQESCFIEVADGDWNLNTNGTYPTYWIKAIKKIVASK